jgi:hypothetical protein
MRFHNNVKIVGTLDFNGPQLIFTGDADESAKVFIDFVAEKWEDRLKKERAAEREACAKVADDYNANAKTDDGWVNIAAAIRAWGEK